MPQVEVNGTRLHVQALGSSSEEPVVMLHGLLVGNLTSWYFGAAAALSARGREVVTYDLRGHGMSERSPGGYDLATMVEDLDALLLARGFGEKPVALVGHSYGALVALHFALRNPTRVSRLALVEAPLPPSRGAQMDAFFAKSALEILGALPEGLRTMITAQKRQAVKFLERVQFLLTETDLLERLRAEEDVPDARLARLTIPTLLAYGRRSELADVGERLARVLPRAELRWFDGGHYLPSETPQALSETLVEYFES